MPNAVLDDVASQWSQLLGTTISTQWFQGKWTVTQDYGPTSYIHEPAYGAYPHFHSGIDLAGPGIAGTPVLAGVEAQITEIGYDKNGYGNYIRLTPTNDPSVSILLGHLKDTLGNQDVQLKKGDALHVGDTTGHVGSTGNSSGAHLHFQVSRNGTPANPVAWLQGLASGQANAPLAHDTAAQKAAASPKSILPGPNFDAINQILAFVTDPKEWWRIFLILVGVVLIFIGLTGYFAPRVAQAAPVPV